VFKSLLNHVSKGDIAVKYYIYIVLLNQEGIKN